MVAPATQKATPPDSGVYLLFLWLERPRRIRIGALGRIAFGEGLYLYAGSGRRTLRARIGRHRRRVKPPRWHIDYLRRHTLLLGAVVVPWVPGRECGVARAALVFSGAEAPVPGFGSSDCGCAAHLAHFSPLSHRGDRRGAGVPPLEAVMASKAG